MSSDYSLTRKLMDELHEPIILVKDGKVDFLNREAASLVNKIGETGLSKTVAVALRGIVNNSSEVNSPLTFTKSYSNGGKCSITWKVMETEVDKGTNQCYLLAGKITDRSFNTLETKISFLEQESKTILDSAPGKLYWKDKDSNYVGANKEWLELVGGKSAEEIRGKRDEFFFGKDMADALRQNDKKVMETGKSLVDEETVELANGEIKYFIATKMPRYNKNGEIIGVVGNSIDITKQKELEKELIKTRSREEKFKAMSTLGAMIAHEIRTPLASIKMSVDTWEANFPQLLKGYRVYAERFSDNTIRLDKIDAMLQSFKSVKRQTKYADNIISTILEGFHYVSPAPLTDLVSLSLNKVVEDTISQYPLQTTDRELIQIEKSEDFIILGKPNIIKHVLNNLIKNALYEIKKADRGHIFISKKRTGQFVDLYFEDTAKGVCEEEKEKIFEPFYTTKSKAAESIGMGLYFCKLALNKMGSEIHCNAKAGEWTKFVIRLNLANN